MTATALQVLVGNGDNGFRSVGAWMVFGNLRVELADMFQELCSDDRDGDCPPVRVEMAFDDAYGLSEGDNGDATLIVVPNGDCVRDWPVLLIHNGTVDNETVYGFIVEHGAFVPAPPSDEWDHGIA
jgi:hypothetical protein